MAGRIATLALERFSQQGFAGTSIADLAAALGISKAAIYYHYPSKDALLHRLVDPLLDAIDACLAAHDGAPPPPRHLLGDYIAALTAHRHVATLIAADLAVLNHPQLGPRIRSQNRRLQAMLVAPEHGTPATLRAAAALGAIWRPLVAEPDVGLGDPANQQTLLDGAVAILYAGDSSPGAPSQPAGPADERPRRS
jgi:AcrR family transcriptional regulator